ncbi:MAG: SusC/RagA family TonB-linked outer membrane protein [Bacteroidales bacterium]|nr:SusC/RagA family TonB-linked outer membrane protein [Bacteroidales bacterium]
MKKLFLAILMGALTWSAWGQTRVSGKVTDSAGEPVPGVAVFVRGTTTATVSDANGNYSIVAKEADNLLFSCIGFEETLLPVGKRSIINVTLAESIQELDQVVVTGYQTISKERATGSFDILGKAQIEKPASSIASRLIGAAPGLAYSTDIYGNPSFSIRGTSTFSEYSAPLIVVDGFPVESSFEGINPNDVESVTILKDAAAASIWGAKSSNGVIVITTKNAKATSSGKPVVTVDYSGFYKISPKLDLDYTLSYASSDDVIDYEKAHFLQWDGPLFYSDETDYSGGNSTVYDLLNEVRLGHLTQAQADTQINALRGKSNYDQIRKYMLQNAAVFQQNLGVNIATERSQTALSFIYEDSDRVYKRDEDKRLMISFRNKTNLFKWLDMSVNGTYSRTNSNNSSYGLPDLSPYEMLVDEKGEYIRYSGGVSLNYLKRHVPIEDFPYQDWTFNPVEEMYARELTSTSNLARIQAGLTFKIFPGLSVDTKMQYEMIEGSTHNYYSEQTYLVRNTVNSAVTWNQTTGSVTRNLPSGGFLDQSTNKRDILTLRAQANFNRTFADKHSIAAIAGVETIDNVYQTFGHPRSYGYDPNTLSVGTFPNGAGGTGAYKLTNWQGSNLTFTYVNSFTYTTDRYFSAFANASYTYDGKYTLSGSVRTDASNLITDDPKYRYAPFWSVGASWQAAKEEFFKEIGWLNALTVRATFGYNGNVDKSTTFKPLLNPSATPNTYTKQYTATMSSYGNPSLRWERTKTIDFGVDYAAFNNRLHGKIDIYNKHSLDLIATLSLPKTQGTSSMKLNNGELSNKGIEIEIGSTLPISKDIIWDGTLMFSYNRNRILSLKYYPSSAYALVYSGGSSAWMEGYDMNTLWSYTYGGLLNKGTESVPDWQPTLVGKDGNQQTFASWPSGDAMNISYDQGTAVAPMNLAFSTSLKIYNFEVSMILTGKFGHVFRRESFNYPGITGRSIPNSKYRQILDTDPFDNIFVPLPQKDNETRLYFWDRFWGFMSYLTENASLIRMQEINVTYNLPKSFTNWLGLNYVKVFAQANNPFSIYFNKWGEDPEFPRGNVPLQSAYLLGLKCNF